MSEEKEINLRDSIRDLRNVSKILDAVKFNFEMNALATFVDGIPVDKPAQPPEDVLKSLLAKFLRGYRDFSSREIRALPHIIYDPALNVANVKEILRMMDFSRTNHLRGVVSVYLQNYDGSNKTELLRQKLNSFRNVDSAALRKIFAARDKLFADERFTNMAKLFAEKLSVKDSLNTIGLSNSYKTSKFIQASIVIFFRRSPAKLPDQFKILGELDSEFDTYKNIFPYIADALIQTVVDNQNLGEKQCIKVFYRRLGDPRFGNSRFNWNNVSSKSKEIFCHWLSKKDLETFFEIINQTAVDKMWRYREKFWRAYLLDILKTKIFFGNNAKRLATQIKDNITLDPGSLRGAMANQSVLVFQIGRYIFSEWSHNGKLRVHAIKPTLNLFEMEEDFFEKAFINRDTLIQSFIEDCEWTHYPNDGDKSWQRKVSDWLRKNCGIRKTERDWGLE